MSATASKNNKLLEDFQVHQFTTFQTHTVRQFTLSVTDLFAQLPPWLSDWVSKYIRWFRPVLADEKEDHLFVTYSGKPREDIHALCCNTVCRLIGVTVPPHAFRTIVASALFSPGSTACTKRKPE
jgi:hypothetical protein